MTNKNPPLVIRASTSPKGVLIGDYLIDKPVASLIASSTFQKHTRLLEEIAEHHAIPFPRERTDDFSPARYRKNLAAWAAAHMGSAFHKQIQAVMCKVWIEPYRELIYKYCTLPGISLLYRINPNMIKALHQRHDMVLELISHHQEAAIRWCLHFNSTPQALKRQFGKGLWKRMLACPAYRQARIISLITRDFDDHFQSLVDDGKLPDIIDFMLSCKASLLERGFSDAWDASHADRRLEQYHPIETLLERLQWVNDNATTTKKADIQYVCQVLLSDNSYMHHKAGWTFRLQSRKKMEESHRKVSHHLSKALSERLREEGIAFYENFPGASEVEDCLKNVFDSFPHLNAKLITSLSMADDEGKAMSHCLFSNYAASIYELKTIAISLDTGKQRTTCAFTFSTTPDANGGHWCLGQHYGFKNAKLVEPEAYRHFTTAVLRALHNAKIRPNGAAVPAFFGYYDAAEFDDIPF